MGLPSRLDLPFFSYGLFRPGQIGFREIRPYVETHDGGWMVPGHLLERDGLPVHSAGAGEVRGTLIRFQDEMAARAYEAISAIEPEKLYRWEVASVRKANRTESVNILTGSRPGRGSDHFEGEEWDGRKEPLFDAALQVVREVLDQNQRFEWDLRPLFRLQMAYMLLWSSIERFASFKYHLGDRAWEKVRHLATEPAFVEGLRELVKQPREIFRVDHPGQRIRLDPSRPEKALEYYYQVRSNIVHRGKAAVRDHEIVVHSLAELLALFRRILDAEFSDGEPSRDEGGADASGTIGGLTA